MEFAYVIRPPPPAFARRKTPLQARAAVTVRVIFEGTIQVLLTDGSTKLNTTRVAQRAGVSVDTLYQYFPNKQSLLYAVLKLHLTMIVEAMESACRDHRHTTVAAMAEAVVKAYVQAKTRQCEIPARFTGSRSSFTQAS